ncbi:hypothetical protein GCM10027277_42790 [Pseudoduganella ginsengisoli]|uniref:Sensor histidine kinase n=1 Tax=Pseudoduganella ginsengisoli TaxID=1462440 RepID=A0A6L6Q5T2_9BURK|nr:sensor histidine kinase [Pseudoduganella ginsengisoli]MTW05117.1 sensor histidine kinase [Pseudoduganella ginsengisoli]
MLNEFVLTHQDELARRCGARVYQRNPGTATNVMQGIETFIRQLVATLQTEEEGARQKNFQLVGDKGGVEMRSDIGDAAALTGKDLLRQGMQIHEVVHHYGDVCQAITDMAIEHGVQASVDEYRILNRCLDNAIAHAVSEFSFHRDAVTAQESVLLSNARTGEFLLELRKLLGTASLAFSATRTGSLPVNGATGAILERTLQQIGKLIEDFSADLLGAPSANMLEVFSLSGLIEEVATTAAPAARDYACPLAVPPVDRALGLRGNRDLIFAALVNLLQRAFAFYPPAAEVTLTAYASGERIRIDILSQCGAAPDGAAPGAPDNSKGHETDLALARRFVASSDGVITTRVLDGAYMFAISLPRHAMPT